MSSGASTAELFEARNYLRTAWTGERDKWQTYAAMGLIGKTEEGISGLAGFDYEEARFYSAVIQWIAGNEDKALAGLSQIETEHARRLSELIRKPKIQVLSQLTWLRPSPHDLITPMEDDPKFEIRNYSFHEYDYPNSPYADVKSWYDPADPPDFYISGMLEWHVKPTNLQDLPCPIFGHTSDFDVHVQAVKPWLSMFDEILTVGGEWDDLRRITRTPVSVFPRVYGLPDEMPELKDRPRAIDVFMSGTSLHAYHPDKVKLYHEVMGMEDVNMKIINGFVKPDEYFAMLGHSKVVFTYYRRDEGPLTRALEALAMGCVVVSQRDNTLGLYVGKENGIAYYDFEKDNLVPVIRRVLDEWPEQSVRALEGAKAVRREFDLKNLAGQYFRFLTFLAAKPRPARKIHRRVDLDQRRLILWKGLLPAEAPVLQKIREQNIQQWQKHPKIDASPHLINNVARELVLEFTSIDTNYQKMQNSLPCEQLMSKILEIFRSGIDRFPRSLVLRFNLMRTAMLFGQPSEVAYALEIGNDILNHPDHHWRVDVEDDIMPWDFCETYFNYRAYIDRVVQYHVDGKLADRDLKRLIRASVSYYMGHYEQATTLHQAACELDPNFPFYKFGYARKLIRTGSPESIRSAGDLLTDLALNSLLIFEAHELLKRLRAEGTYTSPHQTEIDRKVMHALQRSSIMETQPYSLPLKPASMPDLQSESLPLKKMAS